MDLTKIKKYFQENAANVFIFMAFGYFIFRLFFFASHISHYAPPDETTRFALCQVFSKTLLLPKNSEETYSLGLVTHIPYLYYFLMGKCLKLNFFPVSDLVFLRFINCLLSFGTVVYGYKWIRLVTANRICHLLFVILITNTAMFSFLGAAVSYDNMTNFFAVTALYYLHLFFQNTNVSNFLLFVVSILGGALSKVSYLGILIFRQRKQLKNIFYILIKVLRSLNFGQTVLLGIALVLLALNVNLYLNNLICFGKIIPSANQILSEEQAMKHRLYARDRIVSLYKSGRLNYEEAVEKTKEIQHYGDRLTALELLKTARENETNKTPPMGRMKYALYWIILALHHSIGIASHMSLLKNHFYLGSYLFIFVFSFALFLRHCKFTCAEGRIADAFLICIFYTIILMQFVNYPGYLFARSVKFALHGRYFFPVIVPFYGIVSYSLISPFKKQVQTAICLLISIFFIWGDFPYFILNATSQWVTLNVP
jgi:hypothetical protein